MADYQTTNEDFGQIWIEFTSDPCHGKFFIDSAYSLVALDSGEQIKSPFSELQMKHLEGRLQAELQAKSEDDLELIREAA